MMKEHKGLCMVLLMVIMICCFWNCGLMAEAKTALNGSQEFLQKENLNLSFTTIEGNTVNTTANGKPKVILFFSTTCYNSQSTFKSLSFVKEYKNVDFIAVETNYKTKEDVAAFRDTYGNGRNYVQYCYDTDYTNSSAMWKYVRLVTGSTGSVTWPVIVYVDAENKVQYATKGITTAQNIIDNLNTYCKAKLDISISPQPYKIVNVVSGIHVYWKKAEGATQYGLFRKEDGHLGYTFVKTLEGTDAIDTEVVSGKEYYYKVAVEESEMSFSRGTSPINITYVSTPDITLRVNRGVGIGLGWNKIEGATGYAIYRKNYYGNDSWKRVATITNPDTVTWNDISVQGANGNVYRYTVRALAGKNQEILSGCRNTGRTMVRLSSQTLNQVSKETANSVKCKWTTSSKVTGYEVRFMVGDKVYKTVTVGNYKTGTKTFNGLKSGQKYKVQVRSYKKVDGVGSFYSAWSEAKYIQL